MWGSRFRLVAAVILTVFVASMILSGVGLLVMWLLKWVIRPVFVFVVLLLHIMGV